MPLHRSVSRPHAPASFFAARLSLLGTFFAGAVVVGLSTAGGCSEGAASGAGTPGGSESGTTLGAGAGPTTSGNTGTGGDLFGTSSGSGAGGAPVVCDGDKTTGDPLWDKGFGDPSSQSIADVAVDGAGNIVVTGSFTGSIDLGGGALTSAGEADLFVAKFDPSGKHIWSKRYGGAKSQSGRSVAVDKLGNVLVTGFNNAPGTIDFGGGSMTAVGCCFEDVVLAKLDPLGNYVWAKSFGDAGAQVPRAVAVDSMNNVIIAGEFQEEVDFGGGVMQAVGVSGLDAFVAKYDPSGAYLWSKGYGDATEQSALSLAIDASDNVAVAGYSGGTVDFGKGPHTADGANPVAFVAKLSPAGAALWSSIYGGAEGSRANSVAVDGSGGVAITGAFKGKIDIGGGELGSKGNDNVFVGRLDAQGKHLWSHVYGTGSAHGNGVAIDADGKVILAGDFIDPINFGGVSLPVGGGFDAFLVKLDSVGCHVWSKSFGNDAYQMAQAVALDPSGTIVIGGNFAGSIDLGGGPVTAAGDDIFVAKFGL